MREAKDSELARTAACLLLAKIAELIPGGTTTLANVRDVVNICGSSTETSGAIT